MSFSLRTRKVIRYKSTWICAGFYTDERRPKSIQGHTMYIYICIHVCSYVWVHVCICAYGLEGQRATLGSIAWVQPIFYLTQHLSLAWSLLHWSDVLANKPPWILWLHLPSRKAHFLKSSLSFSSILAQQKLWSLGRNLQWRHSSMGILSHWSFIDHSALPLETFSRPYLYWCLRPYMTFLFSLLFLCNIFSEVL